MRVTLDIEANGLLDETTVDYTISPYKLKDTFKIWCIVCQDIDTKEIHKFTLGEVYTKFKDFSKNIDTLIVHNGIDYDLLVLKLALGLDYTICPDSFDGRTIKIIDTMVWSKCLNPDRYGGHSLDEWGKRVGYNKIDWRQEAIDLGLISHDAPKGAEFWQFHPKMVDYCVRDNEVTCLTYFKLEEEKGDWPWEEALDLEQAVAEIITRQKHRGFDFKKERAEEAVKDLDEKMIALKEKVEPVLPSKPLPKTKQKDFTPPAKQFNKDGSHSANLIKFINKHMGKFLDHYNVELFEKTYELPLPNVPLFTEAPATLKDTTHIKEWLVSLGWQPTTYKEKDLTCNTKKQKLSKEKYEATALRYLEQTLNSPFCKDRCEHLRTTPDKLKDKLLSHDLSKPLKVLTNPTFTVGQDKEIDPMLEKMKATFPYAEDIVKFLTYQHRRNSILGGGFDPEEDEDEDYEKGYLANVRPDGRISTPADSCGCATSRFKHRIVANIPRVTSLYGNVMRGLFGVDSDFIQIGYDFDSLEARIESHYCYKWENDVDKPYCKSLILEKPNDVHSRTAQRIAEIICQPFERGSAKSVKYACVPTDTTEVLTKQGWKKYEQLVKGELVLTGNPSTGEAEWKPIQYIWHYKNAEVYSLKNRHMFLEATEDHRWYGFKRKQVGKQRVNEEGFFYTSEINTECSLIHALPLAQQKGSVTPKEAALVGWLLSDGYYKWSEAGEITSSSKGKRKGIVASIAQAEHKFWQDLEKILNENCISFTKDVNSLNNNKVFIYRLKSEDIRQFLDRVVATREDKHNVDWVQWVACLPLESIEAFIHSFWLADGSITAKGAKVITQNAGNIADAVAVAGNLLGKRVTVSYKTPKCIVIRLGNVAHTTGQKIVKQFNRKTDVFCLTTENSTFVMRQGNFISLTGNCSYGAQAPKVAKTIGCDISIGQLIFDGFWEAAKPLALLKEAVTKYWETVGQRSFVLGIDKRKIPTRSKHALVNSLFQSAGVICAKRAMVIHDRKLKDAGLLVDFFREDWRQKLFCQQLIAYHDESQLEVHKSLVKFKTFAFIAGDKESEKNAKEMASQWKKQQEETTGKYFSDVGHTDKCYYVGYCLAGELAVKSVLEAGRYYKLNVDLTAGYMLGTDWASCH